VIKVHLTVGANRFDLEGDLAMAELVALLTQWYGTLPTTHTDDTLRTLTARLSQSTTALAHAAEADAATQLTKE